MKTKYLWRRVISVLVALALFVTGIGINSYAASDDVMLGEKGRLTYTNYLTGTNALVNSFKNHSIQKMTIKPKSGGSGLVAFCIAPGVKFPNEQHSYVYKATSSMAGKGTKYYKGALYYYYGVSKKTDAERIATQLWCWQIYRANANRNGASISASDVLNATSGFKALFINVLSQNINGTKSYAAVSQSKAEEIYNESKQYVVTDGSKGTYDKKVNLTKWTADNSQTLINGFIVEDKVVKLQVHKKGSELGSNALVAGCKYKVYYDMDCKKPVKSYKSSKDAVLTVADSGKSNVVKLDATDWDDDAIVYVKEVHASKGTVLNSQVVNVGFDYVDENKDVKVIEAENEEKEIKISIHKKDSNGKNLSGIEFTTYEKVSGDWRKIESKLTDGSGNVKFNVSKNDAHHKDYLVDKANSGNFKVVETKAKADYVKPNWVRYINATNQKQKVYTYSYEVTNIKKAKLVIHKVDESGNEIEGDADFLLWKIKDKNDLKKHGNIASATEKQAFEREADGNYYAENIDSNSYYIICEEGAPSGHLFGSVTKKPTIRVTDKNGNVVKGKTTVLSQYLDTLNDPMWVNDRIRTEYYIPVYVADNDDDDMIEVTIYDDKAECSIGLQKTSNSTGSSATKGAGTLEGAVYGLYDIEQTGAGPDAQFTYTDNLVDTVTTDANGKASFKNIDATKNYYIQEITPPVGYKLSDERIDVWLRNDHVGYMHENWNKTYLAPEDEITGDIEIYKYVMVNGSESPLDGVEFGIYRVDKLQGWSDEALEDYDYSKYTPEATAVTGSSKSGYAVFNDVPFGKYAVVELKRPHNYVPAIPQVAEIDDSFAFDRKPVELRVENEPFSSMLKIIKKDADTGEIVKTSPCTFKVLNLDTNAYVTQKVLKVVSGSEEEGNLVTKFEDRDEWKTGSDGTVTLPNMLPAGNYQLEEIKVGDDYELNTEPVKFKIDENMDYETDPETTNPIITIEFENHEKVGIIGVHKEGEAISGYENGQFVYAKTSLAGAEYGIYAAEDIMKLSNNKEVLHQKDELITKITTGEDGSAKTEGLVRGKYYVKELKAPLGFSLSSTQSDVEIKNSESSKKMNENVTFINDRQKLSLNVIKVDKEDKTKRLPGAEYGVYAAEDFLIGNNVIIKKGELIESQITDQNGEALFSKDYPVGIKLYAKEITPPAGYISSDEKKDIDFVAESDELTTIKKECVFGDDPKYVSVTKADITTKKEVPGNHLKITYEENGEEKTFDSWVSGDKPHIVKYLTVNKRYKLVETKPADGYVTATAVEFIVKDNNKVDSVVMYDEVTTTEISKKDITTGEEVKGAHLEIVDKNGKVWASWVTDGNPYTIKKLPIGDYVLRETLAPTENGYVKSDDVPFIVNDTGEIQKVEMKDDYTKVILQKLDATNGDYVQGSEQSLYDENGNAVATWTTTDKAHEIDYLKPGTYTWKESKSGTPLGYITADDVTVTVKETGKKQVYTMQDERVKGQIALTKKDKDTGEKLSGAVFVIKDKDTDEEICQIVSGDDGVAATKLIDIAAYKKGKCVGMKNFIVQEISAPRGYELDKTEYSAKFEYLDGRNRVLVFNLGDVYNVKKEFFIPITGDYFNTAWPFILGISVIGLTGVSIIFSKKRKRVKTK